MNKLITKLFIEKPRLHRSKSESEKSLYFLPIQPCYLCPSTRPVQQKSVLLFQNQGASRLVSRMAHLLLGLLIILPLQTDSGEERSLG